MLKKLSWGERVFRRLGFVAYAEWRAERYAQARYLEKLFVAGRIDAVLDVGANRGQYRDFLRQEVGFQGLIVSFEPTRDLAAGLTDRARTDPNWRIYDCALGRTPGCATFNVTRNTEFNSFLRPLNQRSELFKDQDAIVESYEVDVRTLEGVFDELVSTTGIQRPYLKLDTQGFDLEVVAGGSACLASIVAMQTEACVQRLYEGMPLHHETIATLEAQGFIPSAFFPNNAGHFPELIEYDCHLVNRQMVTQLRDGLQQRK